MVRTTSVLSKLIPLFDRVLVKKIEPISKTKSGVLLPEKANRPLCARVVEVGGGARDKKGNVIPMCVKAGDEVVVPEYGGLKVTMDEQEFFIFRESELLGKMED